MAQVPEVEKYETSDNFEQLSFGCFKKGAGCGNAKEIYSIYAKSSASISNFICGVTIDGVAKFKLIDYNESHIYNHFIGFDDYNRVIYLRGEIRVDSLEKGEELTEKTLKYFRQFGLPGDLIAQFIPKSLGGYDLGFNAFNLHPSADIKIWKDAITTSEDHVKADESNKVRFIYVVCYQRNEIRPSHVIHNFKYYSSNDQQPDKTIEGKIKNIQSHS